MATENELIEDRDRGARAEALMRSELLREAFDELPKAYFRQWLATGFGDTETRERLWNAMTIVESVERHFAAIMSNGRAAVLEIERLGEERERAARNA